MIKYRMERGAGPVFGGNAEGSGKVEDSEARRSAGGRQMAHGTGAVSARASSGEDSVQCSTLVVHQWVSAMLHFTYVVVKWQANEWTAILRSRRRVVEIAGAPDVFQASTERQHVPHCSC